MRLNLETVVERARQHRARRVARRARSVVTQQVNVIEAANVNVHVAL
jgi:hypothetical protein